MNDEYVHILGGIVQSNELLNLLHSTNFKLNVCLNKVDSEYIKKCAYCLKIYTNYNQCDNFAKVFYN